MIKLTRRQALVSAAGGAALLTAGQASRAASKTLNVLSHNVHKLVLTTGAAGDLMEPWRKANDAEISWTTFDSNPLQDRLFREASLNRTDFDVGYLIDNRPTSQIAKLFEPLESYVSTAAIESFDDL